MNSDIILVSTPFKELFNLSNGELVKPNFHSLCPKEYSEFDHSEKFIEINGYHWWTDYIFTNEEKTRYTELYGNKLIERFNELFAGKRIIDTAYQASCYDSFCSSFTWIDLHT